MRPTADTWQSSKIRVRITETPCCRQAMVLDHCATADGQGADWEQVALAQRLHLAQCAG